MMSNLYHLSVAADICCQAEPNIDSPNSGNDTPKSSTMVPSDINAKNSFHCSHNQGFCASQSKCSSDRTQIEDRSVIRCKIKAAYAKKFTTFEELLEICSAVEEELIFNYAPSKLDYYKTGIQCTKRIQEKKKLMESGLALQQSSSCQPCPNRDEEETNEDKNIFKRAKTHH